MTRAIIGTGNIDTGLARVFGTTSQPVLVAGAEPQDSPDLAARLAADGIAVQGSTLREAVDVALIVVLAVPYGAVASVAASVDFNGRIVVDVTNPSCRSSPASPLGTPPRRLRRSRASYPGRGS